MFVSFFVLFLFGGGGGLIKLIIPDNEFCLTFLPWSTPNHQMLNNFEKLADGMQVIPDARLWTGKDEVGNTLTDRIA